LLLFNKHIGAVPHRNHPLQSVLFIMSPSTTAVPYIPPACDIPLRFPYSRTR